MRVGHVSSLITQKVRIMAEAEDCHLLRSKYKAISAFLPYAVWQAQDGQLGMLGMFFYAIRASRKLKFIWHRTDQHASLLFSKASAHTIVLASPHFRWHSSFAGEDLFQQWAAATSVVLCTEEVTWSVVNTLLQVAHQSNLLPRITIRLWSWLTKWPSLPPICFGRFLGTFPHVVKAVRGLKDIELLKSYLLLVWSEWGPLQSSDEMCTLIHEDFDGVGMGHHRRGLIHRLDHILNQLDQGLVYLQQYNPSLSRYDLHTMEQQYRQLREVLLDVERRMYTPMITLICILTPVEIPRILHSVHQSFSPISILVSWQED